MANFSAHNFTRIFKLYQDIQHSKIKVQERKGTLRSQVNLKIKSLKYVKKNSKEMKHMNRKMAIGCITE